MICHHTSPDLPRPDSCFGKYGVILPVFLLFSLMPQSSEDIANTTTLRLNTVRSGWRITQSCTCSKGVRVVSDNLEH
ncbi:hypothetical protein BDW75DRAFT_219242 [Aspergillus navahoensis]